MSATSDTTPLDTTMPEDMGSEPGLDGIEEDFDLQDEGDLVTTRYELIIAVQYPLEAY